jgi:hypothetical protein
MVRGVMGEAEEVAGIELEVPFQVLPLAAGVPPVAGQWEGSVKVGDAAAVGTCQQGEGLGMASVFL